KCADKTEYECMQLVPNITPTFLKRKPPHSGGFSTSLTYYEFVPFAFFPNHTSFQRSVKELMEDGIVDRTVYPEIPPRVEYYMTELGMSLLPIVEMMYDWGKMRMEQIRNTLEK
ncbi:winged helix-turn-helix transcriptional regulator, partial [Bacillus sp. HC-Mk]